MKIRVEIVVKSSEKCINLKCPVSFLGLPNLEPNIWIADGEYNRTKKMSPFLFAQFRFIGCSEFVDPFEPFTLLGRLRAAAVVTESATGFAENPVKIEVAASPSSPSSPKVDRFYFVFVFFVCEC